VPIVARLFGDGPQTFASLAGGLSASRDTLTDTLAALEADGVVERRPAKKTIYALTELGCAVGASCVPLVKLVGESDVLPVALKKWPMLVAVALGRGATRYNEAKAALPGITARALALALKDLQSVGMIERTVDHGYPPAPSYTLSPKGQGFFGPLDDLARACEAAVGSRMPEGPASRAT
jgi:DNA-binding HxlR family transcriptional regulator